MSPRAYALRLGAAGVLLAGGLAACQDGVAAAPAGEPGAAACPETFPERAAEPDSRDGALVPGGPTEALLCVYPFEDETTPGGYRLGESVAAVAPDQPAIVKYLNGLESLDGGVERSCTLMGHDQYQIVLGYPDNTRVTVRVEYNCGTVSSAGAVRRVDRMDSLIGFWPKVA